MKNNFKESFEYLMSLSNKELRKEIENSNWNFILQELRYAGDEIKRLNNIINKYKKWLKEMSEYDSHLRGTENDRFIYSNCKDVLDRFLDRKRYTNQTNSKIIYEEFIDLGSDTNVKD